MNNIIEIADKIVNQVFDSIEEIWEGKTLQSIIGYLLVFSFVGYLGLIELQRLELLPNFLKNIIPTNHFYAINFAFTILLIFEVISLVFSVVKSVANSVGMQFEILSLILLRNSFKEFIYFPEPISWANLSEPIYHIVSDSGGALIIFILIGIYYKIQKHKDITTTDEEKHRFISAKKMLSLVLLTTFLFLGFTFFEDLYSGSGTFDFFSTFYTILIFSDILIVLISLKYCHNYYVVFRNSAFAITTVFIRLTLIAPPYFNVGMAIFAGIFTIGVSIAYNYFHEGVDTIY